MGAGVASPFFKVGLSGFQCVTLYSETAWKLITRHIFKSGQRISRKSGDPKKVKIFRIIPVMLADPRNWIASVAQSVMAKSF